MKTTLLLLILALTVGAQDRLEETLRKGIVEEESKQNLNGAIQAYQSVLTQFENDRKTAATALFRMAESYRKLGKNNEAIAAYTRLSREFPDQTRLAEQSRSHLVKTYKLKPQPTGTIAQLVNPEEPQEVLEARRRFRSLMEEEIKLAEEKLAAVQKQVERGTNHPQAVLDVRAEILKLKRDLAAYDAGMAVPKR